MTKKRNRMKKEIELLKSLIKTQSFSSEEDKTALLLENYLKENEISFNRENNNVWATNKYFDDKKPSILLNSHHDTVEPNSAYTNDPFSADEKEGVIYGLGSNDAGASVISLLATFVHFYHQKDLKYNLIIAITAEEESSGAKGLNSLLKTLPEIDFAIVGEPTQMHLAIAEKGLLVLDVIAEGIPGHAAHTNTVNPIYKIMDDIEWFRKFEFDKNSEFLGNVKMSVTQINAGTQHNVVPAECSLVIDVRVNDKYSNLEVLEIIKQNVKSKVIARSTNLNSSAIDKNHPFVQAGVNLGRETYGSPTLSDQSVLTCQSVKLGPGDSTRSHQADEYILISEIEEGIDLYKKMLSNVIIG